MHLRTGQGLRTSTSSLASATTNARGRRLVRFPNYISSVQDSRRVFRAIRDHWKIENQLHYMLDVYLGEDGWSKRAGEAVKNMELLATIDLFIL